jgi:hypothetical protein
LTSAGVVIPDNNGAPMTQNCVLPMHAGGGFIGFLNKVRFTGISGELLLESKLVSLRLADLPPQPRLEIKVFGDSERTEQLTDPVDLTGFNMLAWYGRDGDVFGGEGIGEVTNVTNPLAPGFGRYTQMLGMDYVSVFV